MILTKKKIVALGLVGLIATIIVALGLGLYFGLRFKGKIGKTGTGTGTYSSLKPYTGGITSNGYECAAIGSSILGNGGSAVDAAIATLFCEGVAMPQSMGIGGGFFMVIYTRDTKSIDTLDTREVAPINAAEEMFKGNASAASKGGLSIAVPGELMGYWQAHQRYGKLPWADLVRPTIDLCKSGHLVTVYLANLFKDNEKMLLSSPTLREIYINPQTNKTYEEGQYVKRLELAKTLEIVAKEGADALYNGQLTKPFVEDIQEAGGVITEEDMHQYRGKWDSALYASLPSDQTLYTTPLPSSGAILTFILNILNGFLDHSNLNSLKNWQRIVETFKHGYGKRTELGDAAFLMGVEKIVANLTSPFYAQEIRKKIRDDVTYNDPRHYGANTTNVEDHGTAHISVLAPNGDAVSVTSTINLYFGSAIRSRSTGIILNDEMDDFSSPNITNDFGLPPSPANYIRPGKKPMSSMCPSIVVDKNGDVILVIGAAGGSKITTTVAMVTIRTLWFKETLKEAVDASRIHHQLFPMQVAAEQDFDKTILDGLEKIGHNVTAAAVNGFGALTVIRKINGTVEGTVDRRRGGQVALIRS